MPKFSIPFYPNFYSIHPKIGGVYGKSVLMDLGGGIGQLMFYLTL
jgi:hypothetical protein